MYWVRMLSLCVTHSPGLEVLLPAQLAYRALAKEQLLHIAPKVFTKGISAFEKCALQAFQSA